jgi:hypothetical protein
LVKYRKNSCYQSFSLSCSPSHFTQEDRQKWKGACHKGDSVSSKFSQLIHQQHPHPNIWHLAQAKISICAPALGKDIKIALCKGWLNPERRSSKAIQRNQRWQAAAS